MTLNKIYSGEGKDIPVSLMKLLQLHNPYETMERLLKKAGLSAEESMRFLKDQDTITIARLNRLLSICDIELKVSQTDDLEIEEQEEPELSEIFIARDSSFEDAFDLEDEEEDVLWI